MSDNIYIDPSFHRGAVEKRKDSLEVNEQPRPQWVAEKAYSFIKSLLVLKNIASVVVAAILIYIIYLVKDYIIFSGPLKIILFLAVIAGIISSYKQGKPNWASIKAWFIVLSVIVFTHAYINKLEITRSKDPTRIDQKIYNSVLAKISEANKKEKKVNNSVLWQEDYTFSKQGEVWFTDHILGSGEKVIIIVEHNPIKLIQGTEEAKDLNPGVHRRSINNGGVVAFKNLANQIAKVTVKKSI